MSARSIRRGRERRIEARHRAVLARKTAIGAGAALGATVLFAPAAEAATFTVSNLEDLGGGSLRDAVDDANDAAGSDTVVFQSGLSGTIAVESEIEILEAIDIQGPGANVITASGGGDNRIFYIDPSTNGDGGDSVSISGLTLADGSSEDVGSLDGGAVNAANATLVLTNMVIRDSEAERFGGGVHADNTSLNVLSTAMTGNYAGIDSSNGDGGAIYRDGNPYGPELIRDSVFTNNYGTSDGGAITVYNSYDAPFTIENTTVSGNGAGFSGGGIKVFGTDEDAPITVRNSTIFGNESAEIGGGFSMWAEEGGRLSIENTTVTGNRAGTYGGGVQLYSDEPNTVEIRNSTIVDNTAGDGGGGIYLYHENTETTVTSSIVAGNTAPAGNELFASEEGGGAFQVGFSLIEGGSAAPITEAPAGSNLFGLDPQLGPLQSNGGATLTHVPALGSPVIDKGVANGLATDQRGLARTGDLSLFANAAGGDGTDIGSVEIQAADCKGQGALKIDGTEGNDTLTGTDGPDAISGLGGADSANAGGGNDCVSGGAGKDKLKGAGGKDQLKGDAGKDNLKGGGGKDRLNGGPGKDKLSGGGGKDRLKGGPGKDKIKGGGGKDRINCGGGKDKVTVSAKDKVSNNCEKVIEKG